MKTKYKYFAVGESVFYNNEDLCVRVRVNTEFPHIEYLEDHAIEYYNENWSKDMIEINKSIFDKRFNEILEVIKLRLEL
jgi:hypothetical protein